MILELERVRAAYGRIEVLHGVGFRVEPGTVFALLGPNGAGKSTTLKVISGQLEPTGGIVRLAGRPVNGADPTDLSRLGVCTIPEGRGIFPSLTVRENLVVSTYGGRKLKDVEERTFEQFPGLAGKRGQVAGTLSGGEQQMLALSRALVSDPALLLLDELSMGLAPLVVDELYGIVRSIAARGVSIVIVEQFARTVLGVADRAAIMLHGTVAHEGTPEEVEKVLSAAYLGEG